jgi:hemoglobin
MSDNEQSLYDKVGGAPTFQKLVDIFYARVEQDTELRAIFPPDLEPGKRWQYLFLSQYWGGPAEYAQERGHPRLRMRHAPFAISPDLRNRWVNHMLAAVDEVGIAEPERGIMREYFEKAATFMVNRYSPEHDS